MEEANAFGALIEFIEFKTQQGGELLKFLLGVGKLSYKNQVFNEQTMWNTQRIRTISANAPHEEELVFCFV